MTTSQLKVRDFFLSHPREWFYLRDLSRKLDMNPGNLSRILRRMVSAGLLDYQTKGNQVHFALSATYERSAVSPQEIAEAVRKNKDACLKFCQDLIRIPSVSGENPEEKIAVFIDRFARALGLRTQIVAKERSRPNVIIDSDISKKDSFLFLGHMDTVGFSSVDNWRYYPYSGHIAGGRLYGRGAADMKGGIACEIFLLKIIKDLRIKLPFNVRVILVSNEEGGSTARPIFDLGMDYLIKEGYIDGMAAIYGYGGTYCLGIGHRGVLRAKIATSGESVHTGSAKWEKGQWGVNAVTGMAEILLEMEKFKLPIVRHPAFPNHGNILTPGTMILHGGSAVSMVPDSCESVFELRYLPHFPVGNVYHRLKERAERICRRRRGLRVAFEKFVEIPAVCIPPEEKLVKTLQKACLEVYGRPVDCRGSGPANESFMLIERGIPTVVFGPVGGRAHADNEFLEIHSLEKTIRVWLETLVSYSVEVSPAVD